MATDVSRGTFIWFDLMTTDPGAAIAFYTQTLGWGTDTWKAPAEGLPPYTMWTVDGTSMGGVMQLPNDAPAPPHWMGYIATPDVSATVTQAASLGATVLVPVTPIPTVGAFAVLRDPQGAAFAVYTPAEPRPERDGPAKVGEFSWFELCTSNYEQALAFYSALFGWEAQDAVDMGPLGVYQMFGRGSVPMGGIYNASPEMPMPPSWCYYARVADIGAAVARCTAAGGSIMQEPMVVPGGDTVCVCQDPQGAVFAMHQTQA